MSRPHEKDWWRSAVIYQIYPRSFADSNGDGIGDLPGITAHLDHVARLGADAIWISPFFTSPQKDFGYDISDYRDVDPMYGTLADFEQLVARAHALGLKVMIDQVLSHCSDEHPWFAESRSSRSNPKAEWFVWADARHDGTPPNNWLSVFGGSAWQWDTRRRQYYLHNFLAGQPDLNHHHPEVQQALLDSVQFWLALGVDGFRLDAINFCVHDALLRDNPGRGAPDGSDPTTPAANPYAWQEHRYDKSQPEVIPFLRRLRRLADAHGHIALLGEIGDEAGLHLMGQYTGGGDTLHMAYCFDLLVPLHDAPFLHGVLSRYQAAAGDGWPCWALSNHDCERVATRWGGGTPAPQKLALLAALQLSLPGSVCLYQGEELGLPEADVPFEQLRDPYGIAMWPEFKGRDGCRTPMPWQAEPADMGFGSGPARPWLPLAEAHRTLAAEGQWRDEASLLQHYRRLLAWRRGVPALRGVEMTLLPPDERVLASVRGPAGARMLCAFNFSDEAVAWPVPQALGLLRVADDSGVSGATLGDGIVQFAPWGALFARLDTR